MSYKLPPPPPGLPGSTPGKTRGKQVAMPEWATNIPMRSPVFKVHSNRGQAMNAITYEKREAQLLKLNQRRDGWEIVLDTKPLLTQPDCAWCNASLWYRHTVWHWEVPAQKLVAICHECSYRGHPPIPEEKIESVVADAVLEAEVREAASDAAIEEALNETD